MALIKCQTCEKEYSSEASKCPNCHAKNPEYVSHFKKALPVLKKILKVAIVLLITILILTIAYSAFKIVNAPTDIKSQKTDAEAPIINSGIPTCDTADLHDNLEEIFQQQNPNSKLLEIFSNYEINYDSESNIRSCLANLTLSNGEGSYLYTFSENKNDKGNFLIKIKPVTFDASEYAPKLMTEEEKKSLLGDWYAESGLRLYKGQPREYTKLTIDEDYTTLVYSNGDKMVCRNLGTESSLFKTGFCFKNKKFKADCIGSKSTVNAPGSEYWEESGLSTCPALELNSYYYGKDNLLPANPSTNRRFYRNIPVASPSNAIDTKMDHEGKKDPFKASENYNDSEEKPDANTLKSYEINQVQHEQPEANLVQEGQSKKTEQQPTCEPYRNTPSGAIQGIACKQSDGTYKITPK